MKHLLTILALLAVVVLGTTALSCDSNKESKATANEEKLMNESSEDKILAYYFHATRRCETCESVERVTKETILENYKGQVEFISVNREEDKNKAIVKKYQVNGQTLLLVKGEKSVDLTGPAFMYARSNPEKLETKLKSTIDAML